MTRGKSGGYRVIYYVKLPTFIFLASMYPKNEKADMSLEEIRRIIEEYRSQFSE